MPVSLATWSPGGSGEERTRGKTQEVDKVPLVSRWASNLQLTTAGRSRLAELMQDTLTAAEFKFMARALLFRSRR
jgi:hypothetical protein